MSDRRRYIVAYDIADPKRLRATHKALTGVGDPLQESVFLCDLCGGG
jgi:CRISPR-associated protein Cas2